MRSVRLALVSIVTVIIVLFQVEDGMGEQTVKLSLEQCIQRALAVNTEVLKAGYEVQRSKSSVLTSFSAFLPKVGTSASYSRWETGGRVIDDWIVTTDRSYSTSIYLVQSLFTGGRNLTGFLQAREQRKVSEEVLRRTKHEVAFTAIQKYLEVLRAERLLKVKEEALELSKQRYQKAQAMMEVGSAVRSDVLRAKVELKRNELDVIVARNNLRIAQASLCHFLGIEDGCSLELEDILEAEGKEYNLNEALQLATSLRPELRAAQASLEARKYGLWYERSGWLPNVTFRGSYDWTGSELPERLSTIGEDSRWGWRINLSFDLFTGLRRLSQTRSASLLVKSAEQDLVQTRRDISLEITQAFYNVQEAKQRVEVSKATVEVAEEELKLAEERYRLGSATMLEQIDAQVALSEARTSYIEALYDYVLSRAQLQKAIGIEPGS